MQGQSFAFGPFVFNPEAGTLLRHNTCVPLGYRGLLLLTILTERPGQVLTKAELIDAAWPGTIIEESNLTVQIASLRRLLGPAPYGLEWISTVPRKGYRFSAAVETFEGAGLREENEPSLAVLPFDSASGEPEQGYVADGITEDIITELSKFPGLFVVARNSSFVYKQKAVDVRDVARELGVRYVLEGSVRRAGNRLRITGQLVDGMTGVHVWADRFEGTVEDVFDLQDQLTESIVGAIEPSLRRAEIVRARRKRPNSLNAYDLYLRALPHVYANTPGETDLAQDLLKEALRLDPNYAPAHAYASWCHEQRYLREGFQLADKTAALEHARISVASGDAQAMCIGAFVLANITRDYETAIHTLNQALRINANSALAFGFSALVNAHSEHFETAMQHAQKALRLSPFDPLNYHPYGALALVYLFTDRFEEAVKYSNLAVQSNPAFSVFHTLLVASYASLDRLDLARAAAQQLLEIAPGFSVAGFVRMGVYRQPQMDKIAEALHRVGLLD